MRILITGSSGEIGTNLALRLLKDGHEVFGVDRRTNTWTDAFPTIVQDLSGRFEDYADGIGGKQYPSEIDVVVHLAANAKVHELVEQPQRALDNIITTFNVLEFCRQNFSGRTRLDAVRGGREERKSSVLKGTRLSTRAPNEEMRQTRVPCLPIIFSSSREVYGDMQRFKTEEMQTHVSYTESTYSASKISGEAMVYAYAKCYDLPYIVFRFSNVYGRYDNDLERMERVIPLFIKKIAQNEQITVYGKDKTLDFTYVDDCVDGIVRGIEKLHAGRVKNETINLAYGEGHTLLDLVGYIGEELGKKPAVTVKPARVGEVTHYVADISKARELLGYEPKVNLPEGIQRSLAWVQKWEKEKVMHITQ